MFYKRWKKLRKKYTGTLPPRFAFHALRRKFASDWSDAPTALVAAAGCWKNPEVVVKIYQRPSVECDHRPKHQTPHRHQAIVGSAFPSGWAIEELNLGPHAYQAA
jgi:hypothetical protein